MKKPVKILLILLLTVLLLALSLFAVLKISGRKSDPSQIIRYETDNPYITGETELIAHRFGAGVAPEETMLALDNCLENPDIAVDIYEFDLRLTADDQLVLIHDATTDRTSDSQERFGEKEVAVREKTLEELRCLNMGAKFKAGDGSLPYADSDDPRLVIATLPEVLDRLTAAGQRRMSIEVKDGGETGMAAVDLLYRELAERDLLDSVIFSTFHKDISAYAAEKYPDMTRSNTNAESARFYLAAMMGDENYEPPCTVYQFPYTQKYLIFGINFASAKVLNYAHSRNIAVQYWGGNTAEKIEYLQSVGADGVMTDHPDLMTELSR